MGSSGRGGSSNGSRRASSASTSAAADSPASSGCGPPTPSPGPGPTGKVCTACGREKPLRLFYADRTGRLGRYAHCKVCKDAAREMLRARKREEDGPFRMADLPPEKAEKIRERNRRHKRSRRGRSTSAAWRRTPVGKARRHLAQCRWRLKSAATERTRLSLESKIRELEAFIAERKRRDEAALSVRESLRFTARGGA